MATIKGLLKLKNAANGFDIIMPQTEAALVKMANGETVEAQVMANLAAVEAAQAAADAAQAAADAAQQQADKGVADALAAQNAADAAQADATQALADAAAAQHQADKGVADALAAQNDATQALADALAAQNDATQALADAAAAQQQADKGVADALAAQNAADAAQAAADAAQGEVDALEEVVAKVREDFEAEDGKIREELEEAINGVNDNLDKAVEALEAADLLLAGRLDVIEGEGEGSVKKALQDAKDHAQGLVDQVNQAAGDLEDRVKANEDNLAVVQGNGEGSINKALQDAKDYADQEITKLVDSAPEAMNTLNELAEAIKAHGTEYEAYVAVVAADIKKAQDAADAAQADATQALADALAAQQQADKGVADALAAKQQADKGVADALAAQQQADKGVADALAAQNAADAAQADATQALADALAAQNAADAAQAQADENKAALQAIEDGKNLAGGFVALDENGLVPAGFIPVEFKEIKVVDNIAAMNGIENKFVGLSAFVKDATADPGVAKGGAFYVYDGEGWIKTSESESMDVVLNWGAIEEKPTTIAGYGITDAVNIDELVDAPAANKVLRLNADGKLPADVTGNAGTASKLAAEVNIGINGDDVVAAHVAFDGSQAINIPVVLSNTGVTAGEYTKVQVDAKGRVVAATNLVAADIPDLDFSKITTGKPNSLEGYGILDGVNKAGDTMEGFLTLHANPVNDMHAATKAYVDSMVQGLDVKESVRVATVENINLQGLQTVDGVALAVGDRVLVKNQTNAVENGIYIVAAAAWTRAADAVNGKVNPGMFTFVEEGNLNNNNGFVLTNDGGVVVGTNELHFAQFSGMGQVIVGNGLGKNGNEIFLTDTGVAAGVYTKVQVDAQGRVVAAEQLASTDLPEIAWAVITGKPESAVADIDDAVAKRHAHANAAMLDKINEADGVMTYDGAKMATQAYADDVAMNAAQSMIALSANEPENMPVNGLWIEIIE